MGDVSIDLEITNGYRSLSAWTEGIDTTIHVEDIGGSARIYLTWVEAMQLHKWLGDRLGQ